MSSKSIFSNSIFNVVYKTANVFFPLLMTSYVSRVLLANGVGKISSVENIVQYFLLLAVLGLPTYGTKRIAEVHNDKNKRSKVFIELFMVNGVSTLVCSACYYVIILTFPFFRDKLTLFAITGMLIPFNVINVDWFYQGMEEYRYIMARSVLIKVVALVAVMLYVKTESDYIAYAIILMLSKVLNYVYNIIHIRKYVTISFDNISIWKHFKPVFILLMATLAIEIYTLMGTTMISAFYGDTIVGYYSAATRGISFAKTIVVAICATFLPRLSYYYASNKIDSFRELVIKGLKIIISLATPAAVGLMLVADDAVFLLYGNDFAYSIVTMRILSVTVLLVALSSFIGYQVLVTVGKEKSMMLSTVVGACVNVTLNIILIPLLGHNGAAVSNLATEFVVTLIQFLVVSTVISLDISFKDLVSPIVCCAVMSISVLAVKSCVIPLIPRLTLSLCIGILTYLIGGYITKNIIVISVVSKLKNFKRKQI